MGRARARVERCRWQRLAADTLVAARARLQLMAAETPRVKPVCTPVQRPPVQLQASARQRSLAKLACMQGRAQLPGVDARALAAPPWQATQAYTRVRQWQPGDARASVDPPWQVTQAYTRVRPVRVQPSAAQLVAREGRPEA